MASIGHVQLRGLPIQFSVPAHISAPLLTDVVRNQHEVPGRAVVDEAYGCLSSSILGHGRSTKSVVPVESLQEVKAYRDKIQGYGVSFSYLLNAPYKSTRVNSNEAFRHVVDVIETVCPDSVTVSSLEIARMVREVDPAMDITISTIAGIQCPKELIPYLNIQPRTIVPHHDLGKDFDKLGVLCKFAHGEGIDIRLLVNESCIYKCRKRSAHYKHLASGMNDDVFQGWCNQLKYDSPALWLESGWIRPEDISLFQSRFGIRYFKISGRAKPVSWLEETVSAYVQGTYSGNLVRLLATTPPWTTEPWNEMFVDNGSLQGFLDKLPINMEERHRYCEDWVKMLQRVGKLSVKTARLNIVSPVVNT
ncbi:MAG: hypothetical protein JAY68_06360 [Candidatus Thiodiazotropha taylori]|nr:hypothetical protein [Candidatus Thiodiazotropha taylori]